MILRLFDKSIFYYARPLDQTFRIDSSQDIHVSLKKMFIINEVKFPLWNGMTK